MFREIDHVVIRMYEGRLLHHYKLLVFKQGYPRHGDNARRSALVIGSLYSGSRAQAAGRRTRDKRRWVGSIEVRREVWSALSCCVDLEAAMTTGQRPLRHSWIASDRPVPRLVARPVRRFLKTETSGGIILLIEHAPHSCGPTLHSQSQMDLCGEQKLGSELGHSRSPKIFASGSTTAS
jgi:hypothetical protein